MRPLSTVCLRCGQAVLLFPLGRARRFCSNACRQATYRAKLKRKTNPRAVLGKTVFVTPRSYPRR